MDPCPELNAIIDSIIMNNFPKSLECRRVLLLGTAASRMRIPVVLRRIALDRKLECQFITDWGSKPPSESICQERKAIFVFEHLDLILSEEDAAKCWSQWVNSSSYHLLIATNWGTVQRINSRCTFDEVIELQDISSKCTSEAAVWKPEQNNRLATKSARASWKSAYGLEFAKQKLRELVVWPFKDPKIFLRMKVSLPHAILLYGKPGTGKTLLAKCVAAEAHCKFINVESKNLIRSGVGETENTIKEVFSRARENSPCVLFFDEFQALFGCRAVDSQSSTRMVSQMMMEMDRVKLCSDSKNHVIVLAATNIPDAIDPALKNRFDELLLVGLPDLSARLKLLAQKKRVMKWEPNLSPSFLAQHTEGLCTAELEGVCQRAVISSYSSSENSLRRITKDDFKEALKQL